MKQFAVDIDITMSKRVYVDAVDETQARLIADNLIPDDPFYYAGSADTYVKHEVTGVSETDEESGADSKCGALDYLRGQLSDGELEVVKAQVNKNLLRRQPASMGIGEDRFIDLLEEYGEANNLPEGWWESEGDIDDWLSEL